ncbi:MAG: hypothetical protein JO060_11635, partial [Candidatus Eremiobacteraeota bacterium]|nr:hypothetical protein [Candidatus Eremiobacteraeota bacterium]
MRQALARGLLMLVTVFVIVVYYMPIGHVDFAENWGEGTFGLTLPAREVTVVGVEKGSPADRAGIRPGDRLVGRNLEISSRVRSAYPGERETLKLERNSRTYTAIVTGVANPEFALWQRVGGVLSYLP